MEQELKEVIKQKNNAYWERNQLVAALSKLYPSFLAKHDKNEEWEDDWRTMVVIELPHEVKVVSGDQHNHVPEKNWFESQPLQLSWHIHDTDVPMFDHLRYVAVYKWDGHTTEEKYRRLRNITNPPLN